MVPIIGAFVQLLHQGAFFFIFLLIFLISNGLVLFFSRKNTSAKLELMEAQSLRKEKSLKEREELLEQILNSLPDPVLYKNPEDKYSYCNTALEKLWGVSRQQLYNRTPQDLFPEESEALNKVDRIVKLKDVTIKVGKWLTDSLGRERFFEIHQIPFHTGGKGHSQGILLFFHDVTRIKGEISSLNSSHETIKRDLQERALFYSQFLRKAVKPLDSIQSNTETVMDLMTGSEEADQSLRNIIDASHLMDSYIRNLAFLAFPEKSVLASRLLEKGSLTLEEWQNRLAQRCRGYADRTGYPTYILLSGDVPENLKIDYRILDDLMDRLIENTERFAESGYYIMIRIYRVEEVYYSMNISIRNRGISIPPSMREEIFKPFFQLGDQENSRYAGLGLTVARQLAGKLGGSLSCDPSCNDGARFLLSLPPVAGSGTIISGHRLEGHSPGWPSGILIADDESSFRERLAGQLQNAGLEIFQAPDGEAAVELAIKRKPHLLLVDKKMPLLNGREVIHAVRKNPDTASMDMYLLTSSFHVDVETISSDEESGVRILTKPLDWTILLDIFIRKP